jgi:hypothetical protein
MRYITKRGFGALGPRSNGTHFNEPSKIGHLVLNSDPCDRTPNFSGYGQMAVFRPSLAQWRHKNVAPSHRLAGAA